MGSRRVVLFFLFSLAALNALSASWYVAPGGNDANPGTLASPFATITKASTVARPGDVVNARGGVYYEVVKIASRGTSTARIVFQSHPGERAIIDGTGSAAGTNLVNLNATEWVDFSRFDVRNATRIGICGWGAKNTRILDNTVYGSMKGGIWVGYGSFGSSYGLAISGNTVRNNVRENEFHTATSGWSQAIGVQRTHGADVTANRVYQNDGEGIGIVLSDDARVTRNELFDNYSVNVYLDNAQATTVDGNFVHSTGHSRYYRGGYPAHGIGAANETYSDTNPLTGLTITNNIVLRSRWSFFYGDYENGGGLRGSVVANNTFYEATHAVLAIDSATHTGTTIENNVFFQATGMSLASASGSGITYRTNSWYGGLPGAAAGAGDVVGDPRLVNAGGPTASDYRLAADSPLVERGSASGATSIDYWRQARSAPFDIGAHELSVSGTSAPPPDAQAPTAPSGLSASALSSSSIALAWGASSDDRGVSGYRIFRNGVAVATVTGTSWKDQRLAAATTYSYAVRAFDAAGNVSAASNTATATTPGKKKRAVSSTRSSW